MVTVTASVGTSASEAKWPSLTCCRRQAAVELDHLDHEGIVEVGHRGVVEGQMAVLPDAQTAEIEGMAPEQLGVAIALGPGIGQSVEIVGLRGAGRGRRCAPGSSAGSRPDGRDRRPRTRPCGRRRRRTRERPRCRGRGRRRRPAASCRWRTWHGPPPARPRRRRRTAAASSAAARPRAPASRWTYTFIRSTIRSCVPVPHGPHCRPDVPGPRRYRGRVGRRRSWNRFYQGLTEPRPRSPTRVSSSRRRDRQPGEQGKGSRS